MGQQPVIEAPAKTESEARARLVYWVKRRANDVEITSVRALAAAIGIPESNADRWLGRNGTGGVPLIWLTNLAATLRVDPAWFTRLPPVPEDPLAPYTLPEDDPLLAALDAARLARSDPQAGEGVARLSEGQPPSRPHTRAARTPR